MEQGLKVLIVDDEPPIRMILTHWLAEWGYGIREVGSALEAMDVMVADPADILLCDVTMPEHDGVWLAEQVRTCWPQTAIIMSTACSDPQTVWATRKLGAIAYVTKPYDSTLLRQALDKASGRLRFRPSAEPQALHPSPGQTPSRLGSDGAIEHPLDMHDVLMRGDEQFGMTDADGDASKSRKP